MKRADRVIGIFLVVFGLLCFYEGHRIWNGWGGTGTMAFIVGAFLLAIGIIYQFFPSIDDKPVPWPTKKEWMSIGAIGVPFLLYIGFMEKVGYMLSTWIFMAFTAKIASPTRTSIIVLWTGAIAIGTYIIFKRYLMMYLPEGFIGI